MVRVLSVLFFFVLGTISANAATISMQYRFDLTVVQNAVMCDYGVSQQRYAADCGPSAMASPFESLDIGSTYRGEIILNYADSSGPELSSAICLIGGLNCNFADYSVIPNPPVAQDLSTASRITLGNGWNTMSYFDFGAGLYAYENDWNDFSVFQASLSNITLAPFTAAPVGLTAIPTQTLVSTPLPGGLPLALAGLGAMALLRRRKARAC